MVHVTAVHVHQRQNLVAIKIHRILFIKNEAVAF